MALGNLGGELRASASVGDLELVDGRVPNRIMLLPIGELQAVDGRTWSVKDRAHAEEIVAATKARLGTRQFMMDYDHQAVNSANDKVGGRAAAAGWVTAFSVEDDGIHGEVEWTPAARAALRDREYRYVSPYFGHQKSGRVTRLFNAALTNTPALDMPALASEIHKEQKMEPIIEALGLAEGADEAAIVAAIAGLKESAATAAALPPLAAALGLEETATAEEITAAASAAAARPADLAPVAAALDLATDASVDELAAAASALKAGAIDPAKYVPIETYNTVIAKVAKSDEERATASVDAAIEAGKISPANRQWGIDLFKSNEGSFTTFVSNAPALLAEGEDLNEQRQTAAAGQLTEEEAALCSTLGVKAEDYLATKKELA